MHHTVPKLCEDPKCPQNLQPITLLSTTVKLLEKVVPKVVQSHIEVRVLLDASKFGFRARRNITLQCMRLTEHVTSNFNNNMSTAPVLVDIEKAFDTTWNPGFFYKLYKLQFSTNLIHLIISSLSEYFTLCRRRNIHA
jgi:hypothetical protein